MRKAINMGLVCLIILVATVPSFALLPSEKNTISIFKKYAPLVVNVHRLRQVATNFDTYVIRAGIGSGFVWNDSGFIVTNYHVVRGAAKLAVTLQNGAEFPVDVIGVEPRKDIAVLRLTNNKALKQLAQYPAFELADSSQLQVGQQTIAIGNPFGLDHTLTTGVISALNRRIPGVGGISLRYMIQTDAAINPGNSGGPLLNSEGHLIGMNTAIFSASGNSAGIGFAVPVNHIKRIVKQLIQHGRVMQAGIGVMLVGDHIARQLGIAGVIVADVLADGPAAKNGLRGTYRDRHGILHMGDVITEVDGKPVRNYDDLYNILDGKKIGDNIIVKYLRGQREHKVTMNTIDVGA
ncbi:MAG: trypsin-like peptidase domain-containing protein [Gammaproteobacteria bacterium]